MGWAIIMDYTACFGLTIGLCVIHFCMYLYLIPNSILHVVPEALFRIPAAVNHVS